MSRLFSSPHILLLSAVSRMAVEAAILSKERVTVYSREPRYEHVSICIKDWITLANSRHADRFVQPSNVRLGLPTR